jgi:uncharacterized flavoprotein (TIGR03862 family)
MPNRKRVAIIGGGPAGLMAAEVISRAGAAANIHVDLFEAMPSVARKFLLAGKGGMNITHCEPAAAFRTHYGTRQDRIAPLLDDFGPEALCEWIHGLGIDTFVGSSGRVFPAGMKAAPLLRTWLYRLREAGVHVHVRHRWRAIEQQANGIYSLCFDTPKGEQRSTADVVILALGGGSWAKLGSDGRWVALLEQAGIPVAPLRLYRCRRRGASAAGRIHDYRLRRRGRPHLRPLGAAARYH